MGKLLIFFSQNPDIIVEIVSVIGAMASAVIAGVFSYRVKRRESELQKEIAKVMALNEQMTYIKNSCFDYEFDIYKELSKKTFLLTSSLNTYFFHGFREMHSGKPMIREKADELLNDVIEAYYSFRDTLYMSGPFMPGEQFDEFEQFMKLCFVQYQLFYNAKHYENNDRLLKEQEAANRNDARITEVQRKLIKSLRLYLSGYMPAFQKTRSEDV